MSRTSRFLHNSLSTALYQLCVMAYGFVIPRIMLVYYGSELNGLVSSVNQIITYLNLVEAGLAGAAVFALYKPLANKDTNAINGVVSAAKKFYNQSGFLFTGLMVLVAIIYPILKPVAGFSPVMAGLLILILGAKGFIEFFTLAKYRALLTADQRTYVISNASTIYTLLNLMLIAVFAMLGCNIVLVYLLALTAVFARSIFLLVYVRKHYKYLDFSVSPNIKALDKRWDALYLQILGAVHRGAPLVLATVFFSLTQVSIYSVYNIVFTGLNSLLGIFTNGLSASFGDVIARGELKTLQRAARDFELAYYILISVIYAVAYAAIMPFVSIYTAGITDANYYMPTLGATIVLSGFLYSIKNPQGMLVISAGLYKETRWRSTIQAVLIVGLGAALIPVLGLPGIAVGACLGDLYRDIDLAFYIPRYVTKTQPSKTLLRMLWAFLTCACSAFVCSLISFPTNNYFEWILLALMYVVISLVITMLSALLFYREGVKSIIMRLKGLRKHRTRN